ncbi:uncharacterized protein LOC130817689 [Amaranthus tricolor]|uniref:uncharacterized protein LOC130817689 n=1 Tax=Amaranthus tricolor TaxID=29722 RepID=UPI00258E989B|nr:uncharacterized protein LOC130817689 [Amaranthus tricolor]
MYPKVKVRSLEGDNDNFDFPIIPIEGFDSFSIRDSSPPVKGVKLAASVARIPRSYIPRSITPPPSLPTPAANKSELEQDGRKPRIRASSIPRPRAVVSSPDNDQILGTKNKMRLQRPSAMRTPTLAQSRQLEGRSTRTMNTKKPLKSIESKATTHTKDIKENKGSNTNVSKAKPGENKVATRVNDVKERNVSTLHVRVPISDISKAKPCFMVT